MSKPLDKDGLRRDPQNVRQAAHTGKIQPEVWYYEDRKGLHVVVDPVASGGPRTISFVIPKAQVLRYARVAESVQ